MLQPRGETPEPPACDLSTPCFRLTGSRMSRVADVTANARATASGVKDLADSVAVEAEGLEEQVRRFLSGVQAA
jgi:hypothetical protein